MFDGVVFDFDGVIIDSEPAWEKAKLNVFHTAGLNISQEKVLTYTGKTLEEFVEEEQLHFGFDDHLAKQLVKDISHYATYELKNNVTPLAGIYEAIDYFLVSGKKLAIASSAGSAFIKSTLNKLNLQNVFKIICSAENEEYGKPHPAVYISACKKLELSPLNAIAIEDSLTGLLAAKAAKMSCILIKHPNKRMPAHEIADKIIKDLTEIKLCF
jgi:mannitol-1-/sugar-/sorbitol-6-/2-deoxyglucose-6-phosphatase